MDINRWTVTFPVTDAPEGRVAIEASAVVLSAVERSVKIEVPELPSASKIELAPNVRTPVKF
jgi:hypothetical protein